ncbi:MAG: disulfide bond formation protein B [Parachlamydiaceae bacterium]
MERNLNAAISVTLNFIILSTFGIQVFLHEQPCSLCLLQRTCMIVVSIAALLNVRFGVKMSHYSLMLLSSILGGAIALRQVALHVCPGEAPFGTPVLGLGLYTWAFIIFACCIMVVALLLLLFNPYKADELENFALNHWHQFALGLAFIIIVGNIITSLILCGVGPCLD